MRYRYIINGIVQGVGFRPTVYKIATNLNLKGFVQNLSNGVIIEIEGENKDKFLDILLNNLPSLAKIDTIKKEILEEKKFKEFKIIKSKITSKTTSISPDIAICDECLDEMFDKNNRRYLYPFINCINCGPRYTIIKDIPYDRKNTSMRKFTMCKECKKEYENPLNRRYHAQPISCFNCGPKLSVKSLNFKTPSFKEEIEKIEFIANKIKEGKIVAIKGLGGFHLICDATNKKVVNLLRKRKNRPSKPFAMMFKNIDEIKKYCFIDEKDEELILSKEKPIVLVKKKVDLKGVADNIDRYGVFLPYTPIHYLLFKYLSFPIIATSANISDEPIIKSYDELIEKLPNVVDYVLDNDREIINACDDSVICAIDNDFITLRCARGYAPFSIKTTSNKYILGVGANQKNTISLSLKDKIILSPHIGDLNTIGSVEYFEKTVKTFRKFYNFKEDIIICDKHPLYESTKWALSQEKETIFIQHHYAHALSTMFEFNLDGDFLAFIFDGTGYGDDKTIWGGEVFIVNRKNFKRVHYFKPFKLIGGEKGIKNPSNLAVSLLDENVGKEFKNYNLAKSLLNVSFPITSSMGRIFDMVAFLGGMIEKNEWEGLSGLMIEKYFNENINKYIDFEVNKEINFYEILNFAAKNRGNYELISSVFINSIVNVIYKISKMYDLDIIVGGGVFQNKTLLKEVIKKINKKVYFNKKIPINDGGISVGQVAWGVWNL